MRVKIDIKNINNILIEEWNWKKIINFTKRSRQIINQTNKDQIEKYNTINLNWRMKLKNNKTFTKRTRQKIRNSKNEDQIEEYNIW
jgi:hypothetical protein